MGKISIITINYNNSEGLARTLKSIYSQTYTSFETIVIDGGSTDSSVDVILNYKDEISYWVSEKDNGIYNAMNKGIRSANNEYVLFLNSGDVFSSKSALADAIPFIVEEDLISFNINFIGKETVRLVSPPKEMTFSYMYAKTLPHPSTFIKKSLFEIVGFYDESFKIASDWKFYILALFKHNCSYKNVDIPLVDFYLDGVSSGKTVPNEGNKVLEENFSRFISDYEKLIEYEKLSSTYTYKVYYKLRNNYVFKKTCALIYKVFYGN
ncbi:glycosyltransferase family 2 protein [Hyunsoonleella ulvae]|uniref:glycosyltransferase family 2 protein n=1 Tax=Hyunsoonleella ulvae TaxID=2799948 RepID=UPI0019397D52|nr:glycosyltransferase family 2 protein [Hyunsoonleella ulvae]